MNQQPPTLPLQSQPVLPTLPLGLLIVNGILRLYDQFPRCYEDIYQMTLQLPEIAAMGFNAVWINPIQETGKRKHTLTQDPLNKGITNPVYSGSLYAIKDTEKIDDAFTTDKQHNTQQDPHDILALRNYTKAARELGLTPIFDLVLNQVALDAEVYNKHKEWFIPPKWNVYLRSETDVSKIDLSKIKGDSILFLGRDEKKSAYFVKNMGKDGNRLITTNTNELTIVNVDLPNNYNQILKSGDQDLINRDEINGNLLTQIIVDATEQVGLPPNRSIHFGPFCCDFDFNNSRVKSQIMAFLKEEIRKYIVDYGFMGVRIDAAKHLPIDVQNEIYAYINELCIKRHNVQPVIYAEVIASAGELKHLSRDMQGLGITHIMNSLFHERFTNDYRQVDSDGKGFWEKGPKGGNDVLYGLGLLRQIVHGVALNVLGGTVGYPGTHDFASLYDAALSDHARSFVEKQNDYVFPIPNFKVLMDAKILELRQIPHEQQVAILKEKLAAIAITSDAGWYLLSGDEFGHSGRKWVFDFYNPCEQGKYSFENHWGSQFDLRPFIKGINNILASLPAPDPAFWVQHIVLNSKPDLMIAVRHNGRGFDKTAELIIINLSDKQLNLSIEDVLEISQLVSMRADDSSEKIKAYDCVRNALKERKIFCLGNIKLQNLNPRMNVVIADTSFSSPPLFNSYLQIAERNPQNPIVHFNLGNAAFAMGNTDLATRAFLNSFELLKKDFPKNIKQIFELAASLTSVNCHEQALVCYKHLVHIDSHNPSAHYYLGQTALIIGASDLARTELQESYKLFLLNPPQIPQSFYLLADALYKCNLPKESSECYKVAVNLFPNDPTAHYHVGVEYSINNQAELAQKEFKNSFDLLQKFPPKTPKYFYMLAEQFSKCGLNAKGFDCYMAAANIFPNDPIAHYHAGVEHLINNQPELAQKEFKNSFDLFQKFVPQTPEYFYMLAEQFSKCGLNANAFDCYTAAVKIFPNDPNTHFNYGQAALQINNRQFAQHAFLTSYNLFINNPQSGVEQLYKLAGALNHVGCLSQALGCYKRIVDLNMYNPVAHYNLGVAALALEQKDLARQALMHSLELFKTNPPPDTRPLKALESAFKRMGLEEKAIECMQQIKRVDAHQNVQQPPKVPENPQVQTIKKGFP